MKTCNCCKANHDCYCPICDYEKFTPTLLQTDYADKGYLLQITSFWTSPTWFGIKLTAAILAFLFALGYVQGNDAKMAQIAKEHAQMMQEKSIKDKREEELQAKFDALAKQGEYLTNVKTEKVKK